MRRKIILFCSSIFILFMASLFIYYLVKGDSSRWQVSLGGIFASAQPILLLFKKRNPFNSALLLGYYLFLFCSLYLGSIAGFYLHHKWWDSTLHLYKGMYVAFCGITLYKVFIPKSLREEVSKWILFLFTLSLGVMASLLWEIYEFIGDLTFTHTMQRGGNTDTMYDLLFGLAGGLSVALFSFRIKHKI